MPEIACTSATAQGQHLGDQQVDDEGLDAVLHGMLSGNRALHFGHSSASTRHDLEHDVVRRSRSTGSAPQASQAATVSSTMVLRRLSPICRFGFGPLLPARFALSSVCDGGRPEFRLVRGFLQKDDDEDVEDADHGLFRHLTGRTQRRSLGRFELLARRPSPSPGLAASIARRSPGGIFRYSALRLMR